MTGHGEKLSPKAFEAIDALLVCDSITAAARRAGLREKTIRRWLALPIFKRALHDEQRRRSQAGLAALEASLPAALATLTELLSAGTPAALRLRAATTIVSLTLRATELVTVDQRLAALEAAAAGRHRNGERGHA